MSARICDTGDWHLTSGARFDATLATLHQLVDAAIAANVDLFLVKGDMAGTTVPYRWTEEERMGLLGVFVKMGNHAPVIVLYGNHDPKLTLDPFAYLATQHDIFVVDHPEIVDVDCGVQPLVVVGIPYPEKRDLLLDEEFQLPMADQTKTARQRFAKAVEDKLVEATRYVDKCDYRDCPIVVAGHFTIDGSLLGGGEYMLDDHELGLTPDQVYVLRETGADAVLVSHIHKRQEVGEAHYPGSPSAQNFGEETDLKSWSLVTVAKDQAPTYEPQYTAAPRLYTLTAEWREGAWVVGWPLAADELQGAEVRIRATVPEEARDLADREDLKERAGARGASLVQVEVSLALGTRVRAEEVATMRETVDKLGAWFAATFDPRRPEQEARLVEKLQQIEGGQG